MPTQVTYRAPGHQAAGGVPARPVGTVHSQLTLSAPWRRNRLTMCRHAATKAAGRTLLWAHGRPGSFMSCPKPMTTASPKFRTLVA